VVGKDGRTKTAQYTVMNKYTSLSQQVPFCIKHLPKLLNNATENDCM